MIDIASSVKEAVSMPDVCETYGIQVDRGGFTNCPFHGEKTGSLKIYPGRRGFYCFGCHKGGDVIDFVAQYFGLDFKSSIQKLNDDFHLGLPVDGNSDRDALREARRAAYLRRKEAERRKKQREALQKACDDALSRYTELDTLAEKGRSATSIDDLTPEIVFAMQNVQGAWYDLCNANSALYTFDKSTA